MNTEQTTTITVDGKVYPLTDFSETVQNLVNIHTSWRVDLQKERLAVAKTEAAIRSLEAEINQHVANELTEKAEQDAAEPQSN